MAMFGAELLLKALEALDSKNLHVNPMQCSRFRHQLSKCQLCTNYCPTGAISWDESLDIDVDKCTGCGICANVCPNGVFEANNPSNDSLLSRAATSLKSSNQIAFVCSKHQHKADPSIVPAGNILIVPCLGRIDESLLVGCVSLGAKSVRLVNGLCHNCEFKAWEIIQQTVATANKILSIFNIQEKLLFSADMPGWGINKGNAAPGSSLDLPSEQYSRRDFFKAMTRGTKRAAILAAGSIIERNSDNSKVDIRKSGLPFYLPRKRTLLLESITKLRKPISYSLSAKKLPLWQLKIDDACTGCGMCAYFCPTGALKKTEDDGKIAITFQLSHCTGCNLCQEICYKRAISVATDISTEKLLSDQKEILFVTRATD
jgi:Pyruvate/2-oxoacid:ferredoxin oxidoreductase delta subunit